MSLHASDEHDYLFKVVLLGDSGVGKSQLLSRFARNAFDQNIRSTIGVDFAAGLVKVNGSLIKLQTWDTAGQERFRALGPAYFRGAAGAIVVYDVTQQESFQGIKRWLNELDSNVSHAIPTILVGNKCDLQHLRSVEAAKAHRLCVRKGLSYIETSALDATNVEAAFQMLAADIHYQMASHLTATGALDAVIPDGCRSLVSSITASQEAPRGKAASCCSF
eukprot:jgi/Astpho2/8408/Aster-01463